MYVGGTIFLFLGLYLNEVIPHDYGVPKHPLFFLSKFKAKKPTIQARDVELTDDELLQTINFKGENIQIDLRNEDDDVRNERKAVEALPEHYDDYALVIKNLRKIYPGKNRQ